MSSRTTKRTLFDSQTGSRTVLQAQYSPEGGHTLHEGDVRGLLELVEDESVRLIVTSPPYNIGKEYEQSQPLEAYLDEQLGITEELVRVLAFDGSLCWQVGNYVHRGEIVPLDVPYYQVFKAHNLRLRNRIIWTFNHGLHASKRFSGRYETILWFTKSDDYVFNLDSVRVPAKYPGKTHYKAGPKYGKPSGNPKGKNPGDIWRVVAQDWEAEVWDLPNVKSNHCEKTLHPCQYPIELIQRLILALTNEGDTVLDPFGGSGTTILAAALLARRGVAAEMQAEYCNVTRERFAAWQAGELKVRRIGTAIHQPTGREKVSQVPKEWLGQR